MTAAFRLLVLAVSVVLGLLGTARAQDGLIPNLNIWETDAARAEAALTDNRVTNLALEQLRGRIVDWRSRFAEAQSANAARIETLRNQISALGPAPAEGQTEAEQIAARRSELNAQLAELQAPGITAVEALSRAEGIISQIDRRIRERQASALLKLSPTPLNPINWPAGIAVLTQGLKTLGTEVSEAWNTAERRAELRNNLPVVILFLAVALLLVWKGPGFMERLTRRLQGVEMRTRNVAAALVSLGQVVVPVVGTMLLVGSLSATGMIGLRLGAFLQALPAAAFAFFSSRWLGSWLFRPDDDRMGKYEALALTDRPAEGRFLASMIGFLCAAEAFRLAFVTEVRPPLSQAAQAVWAAPVAMVVSVFVFRLGMLLRQEQKDRAEGGEAVLFRNRLISLVGTASVVVAVVAPVLAAIGYVAAANALIWPAVFSLGLIGIIILIQRFLTDIYLAVMRGEASRDALIPVLAGFLLSVGALPLFALIWGARTTDLAEVWTRFTDGVTLGDTRISPTAFLTFAVVFAIGFMMTRLMQGALRTSILPRTRLDKGVQNAIGSGVGYLGLFLAGLVAINSAGINLSSLAIVAGALSLGIGFGLQNIVSNFVSGIILLIERPISEGDYIEVGPRQGTVKAISVRSTRIETPDRTDLIVPNADLVSGVVNNWTRSNMNGRLVQQVLVAHGADTRHVQAILQDIADAQPLAMLDPPPSVGFLGHNPDGLIFEIRIVISDMAFKGDMQSEINHEIVRRFAEEGIELPRRGREPDETVPVVPAPRPRRASGRKVTEPPITRAASGVPPDPKSVRNDPDEGIDPDRR
jgi:small-conductance mechanosensitive channel